MTRHRIAQIGKNRNPKSPENRLQTRRFLQIRLLQLRRSATPFNGLAVLHGRPVKATKKPGRRALRLFYEAAAAAWLLALQLDDFVLDAEFLTLQIVDRLLVGKGTMVFFIDGAIERSMLFSKRLDAIMQRHALPSC